MFHSLIVKEDKRYFLCFDWFKDNETSKEIIKYCMRVHVFGNSVSVTSVDVSGPGCAASHSGEEYGSDARHYIKREFYVDNELLSLPEATGNIIRQVPT